MSTNYTISHGTIGSITTIPIKMTVGCPFYAKMNEHDEIVISIETTENNRNLIAEFTPEPTITLTDNIKIVKLFTLLDFKPSHAKDAMRYIRAHNLERHFTIRER